MSSKFQHKEYANGKWNKLGLFLMMGNIGSEVSRTIKWKELGEEDDWKAAFFRSLELFDLTIQSNLPYSQRREIGRAKEAWIDFIWGDNEYKSTPEQWTNYFDVFVIAYRNQQHK